MAAGECVWGVALLFILAEPQIQAILSLLVAHIHFWNNADSLKCCSPIPLKPSNLFPSPNTRST